MKTLEIFSGAGGLAKGLEVAGFDHAGFVEFNKDACDTLRVNFTQVPVYEGDVRVFEFGNIGEIDVVAGGPPCQPFSLGGKHKASLDERDMFPEAIRAIETLQPKAFIFENVKGLLRTSFASYFEYIIKRLENPSSPIIDGETWEMHLNRLAMQSSLAHEKRYKVNYKLLNAADYGVPQKRERVFIVGVRSDLDVEWSFPEPTHSRDRLLWDMYVTGEYWEKHGMSKEENDKVKQQLLKKYGMFEPLEKPWVTVRDALSDLADPRVGDSSFSDHKYKSGAKIYPGHTGSYIDEPSKTIKAGGHGVPGGENMIRFEDGSVRYFTVQEAKRIQTFPEDFCITGAWGEAMRQIGNAVPVRLASEIGQRLRQALSKATMLRIAS